MLFVFNFLKFSAYNLVFIANTYAILIILSVFKTLFMIVSIIIFRFTDFFSTTLFFLCALFWNHSYFHCSYDYDYIVSITIYLFLFFFFFSLLIRQVLFSHIVSEKITVLFAYCDFNIILYFILRSIIFCCHSFHYQFTFNGSYCGTQ